MKSQLRRVIQAFITLKQLSLIPTLSWIILCVIMSSVLPLAGVERTIETMDSKEPLGQLSRSLPHCRGNVADESAKMAVAPYCHGLEALDWLNLNHQVSRPRQYVLGPQRRRCDK